MRFKKIALALFACLALGAFAANAAQATEGDGWTIGTTENQTTAGTLIPNGTHERVSCKKHGTSSLVFTSTLLGSALEVTIEGVDCLERAGSTNASTIDNTTKKGHSEGVLTFTGVKVVKPANCELMEITTNPLTDEVIMDPSNKTTGPVYDKFFPEVAANGWFTFEFTGPLCSLEEDTGTLKGTACGESAHTNGFATGFEANKTGTLTKVQTLAFGNSSQQTTGGCALTFNGAAALLSGAIDTELTSGKPFGSD
jgi:hypothetical protein